MHGWWDLPIIRWFKIGFITENTNGTILNGSHPAPKFSNLAAEEYHCPFMALYSDLMDEITFIWTEFHERWFNRRSAEEHHERWARWNNFGTVEGEDEPQIVTITVIIQQLEAFFN